MSMGVMLATLGSMLESMQAQIASLQIQADRAGALYVAILEAAKPATAAANAPVSAETPAPPAPGQAPAPETPLAAANEAEKPACQHPFEKRRATPVMGKPNRQVCLACRETIEE